MSARQERPFDPARAARLDDPERFAYLSFEEVLALLDPPHGATVVDYGAGTGAYAVPLAQRRPDLRVVALDVQPAMLDLLRAKPAFAALSNLDTVVAADATLRGTVARVLAINVLHELDDDAMRDVAALLAPGGRFVSIDWDAATERPVGPPAAHVYAIDEARQRLRAFGLRLVGEGRFAYHHALLAEADR